MAFLGFLVDFDLDLIRFGFGFDLDLISISLRFWLDFGLLCFRFWSIIAFTALIALPGGPREVPSEIRRSSLGKVTRVTKSYKSHKVHNRI